ncbi:MAG: DUF4132 domain-containing protein [Bacillota bacterium]
MFNRFMDQLFRRRPEGPGQALEAALQQVAASWHTPLHRMINPDDFLTRLEGLRGEPVYDRLLAGFFEQVLPRENRLETELRALDLALARPALLAACLDGLARYEQERQARIARFDTTRTELRIRDWLTRALWPLAYNPHCPFDGDRTPYQRALQAIRYPGQEAVIREMAAQPRQFDNRKLPQRNVLTGEWPANGAELDRYLAQLRALGESDRPLLEHVRPDELRRIFMGEERLMIRAGIRLLLELRAELSGREEAALPLLRALISLGEKEPKKGWWELWEAAARGLEPGELVRLADRLWAAWEEQEFGDELGQRMMLASVWGMASVSSPEVCRRLARRAVDWVRRQDGGISLGLAAIRTLLRIGGDEALAQLQWLEQKIKHKVALRAVQDALQKMAGQVGMDAATLQDLSVESFGLDPSGRRSWELGEYRAELELNDRGRVESSWLNRSTGKRAASLPKPVREAHPEAVAAVKEAAKGLQSVYATQRARLEQAMVEGRTWDLTRWEPAFGANPVLKNLAGRLIWSLEGAGGRLWARPAAEGWVDAADRPVAPPPGARLRVAHPLSLPPAELSAWQQHVVRHRLVQPFKQAFRECYTLTPEEVERQTHSNRFAHRLVQQKALYALLKGRGWSGLGWLGEGEVPAYRDFPAHGLRATLEHQWGERTTEGILTLDYLWFAPLERVRGRLSAGREPLPLSAVDPVALSEAMRDVDLVASVAGEGLDTESRGARQAVAAEMRITLLREMLPAMGLEGRFTIQLRTLHLEGRRRRYAIGLESGNVYLEPERRSLIIPAARRGPEPPYLPFEEEDSRTVQILTTVLLLAGDDRITDPELRRQLDG